jgi:hypothetical protein
MDVMRWLMYRTIEQHNLVIPAWQQKGRRNIRKPEWQSMREYVRPASKRGALPVTRITGGPNRFLDHRLLRYEEIFMLVDAARNLAVRDWLSRSCGIFF